MNMNILAVITPHSIYHVCSTYKKVLGVNFHTGEHEKLWSSQY